MSRITASVIQRELDRINESLGAQNDDLPTINDIQYDGRPNISIEGNNVIYYEAYERGNCLFRIPAFDLNHLMFMVFDDLVFGIAGQLGIENRVPEQDPRRMHFDHYLRLMKEINPRWNEMTNRRINNILRYFPFLDQ